MEAMIGTSGIACATGCGAGCIVGCLAGIGITSAAAIASCTTLGAVAGAGNP